MKEFETWSRKYIPRNLHSKAYGEAAWKAALEWVLNDVLDGGYVPSVSSVDVIKEELND